jgi:hypothetical protein
MWSRTWFPPVLAILLLTLSTSFQIPPAHAQEAWCLANPANCICSEPLQATSYSQVSPTEFYGANEVNPKKCTMSAGVTGAMMRVAYGPTGTIADLTVANDPTILALLPNRDTSKVVRYLRRTGDYLGQNAGDESQPSTWEIGYDFSSLSGWKRIELRFYRYVSSDFEWGHESHVAPHNTAYQCTNSKFAHNEAQYYNINTGMNTMQTYGNIIGGTYPFGSAYGWHYDSASDFLGLSSWIPTSGSDGPINLDTFHRGKWVRYEIVICRPATADAQVSGYDYEIYLTDVTDAGTRKQDIKFSNGCTQCMSIPSSGPTDADFVWSTSTYPVNDMNFLYMLNYRASDPTQGGDGYCYGWDAVGYFVVAAWTTDAGQMVGAASEVEGGSGSYAPSPPSVLQVLP